jgi:hypothetical protein
MLSNNAALLQMPSKLKRFVTYTLDYYLSDLYMATCAQTYTFINKFHAGLRIKQVKIYITKFL